MPKMKKMSFFLVVGLVFSLSACGSRMPSPQSSQSITRGFFKSYGHKYKTSLFGSQKVTRIEINSIQEQARNLAEVDALLGFNTGESTRVLMTLKKRPPFGWRVVSWEMLPFN